VKKVLITRRLPNIAKEILSTRFSVDQIDNNKPLSKIKLIDIIGEYDGVLSTVTEIFDKSVLLKSKKLKVISNYAVGLDNIDLDCAGKLGINVFNTPDQVTNSTADLTIALLLTLLRKLPQATEFAKENKWSNWDPEIFLGEELNNKTLGILGFGKIGQAVARRAIGFGLNIVYYNHTKKKISTYLANNVESLDYKEVLENSDYLSIHLPLNDQTRGFINFESYILMKKYPVILNMSRGDIVNTNDLIKALKKGQIRGAALDVTSPEPLPSSNQLYSFENCIISPHIGTATNECRYEMAKASAKNILNNL
jgi:glyoxylate reductase